MALQGPSTNPAREWPVPLALWVTAARVRASVDGTGPGGLAPLQPFTRSEKVVTGVISAPWSPGEVASSLFPSAGQLGRAGSITSAIPPALLWDGLDVLSLPACPG